MTLISEHTETDTRERILVVAERLFRQIGYQKTTVADIAKELRMSPANVYRLFDSKKAIHEGGAGVSGGGGGGGVASGEFEAPELPLAALCTCTGMMRFFHPQMIAQAVN